MEKICLIDGNSLVFRAYYATLSQRMNAKNGVETNAVYGFNNMLFKALEVIKPNYAIVAFDAGKKTFRHQLFDAYKGTRREVDESLVIQFPIVRELLDSIPILRIEQEGYEADDIIGSLAKQFSSLEVVILTSDRDLLQLISPNVTVCLMKKGITEMQFVDLQVLQEEYSVKPYQVIELKALMGDSADNIPGIKGIGEKTALKLISEYQNIDELFLHVDQLKGKLKEKIESGEAIARLSKELATIYTDMAIEVDLQKAQLNHNYNQLATFYRKYDMNSLLKKIEIANSETTSQQVHTLAGFDKSFLQDDVVIAVEFEGISGISAMVSGLILSTKQASSYLTAQQALQDPLFLQLIEENYTKKMIDGKTLLHFLKKHQIKYQCMMDDLLIGAYLVDSNVTTLDKLKDKYDCWSETRAGFDDLLTLTQKSHALFEEIHQELISKNMLDLYEDIEMPLVEILVEMEQVGIQVDKQQLVVLAAELDTKVQSLSNAIYEMAGQVFNVNSPKQLAEILFDVLKLPANKKRSTAVDVLEKLYDKHPIIPTLLEYRKFQKFYSTYAVGLQKYITEDSRIHTTFNQTIAQTGRLSSIEPNLQNISVRDQDTRSIRKVFVADEGYYLLSCDYSQIELRVLAHMASVSQMIEAFNQNIDIHTLTASQVFEVGIDEVTSAMRRQAKAVNFGIVYGISDFGLSQQLDIDVYSAKQFIDTYHQKFKEIEIFMDQVVADCEKNGYVETLYHRRRLIPEIHDKNFLMRSRAKRMAMNAPIQGTAADIIKIAMVKVYDKLKKNNLQSKLILQVHDELVLLVKQDELEIVSQMVVETMRQAVSLSVKMDCSLDIGKDWYEI